MKKINYYLLLSLAIAGLSQIAQAEEFKYQGITVNVSADKMVPVISVSRPNHSEKLLIEVIEAPPRVVIDIPKYRIASNKSFQATDTSVISGARFGVHPDKTRLVLDLVKDLSTPSITSSGSKTTITFGAKTMSQPSAHAASKLVPTSTPIELKRLPLPVSAATAAPTALPKDGLEPDSAADVKVEDAPSPEATEVPTVAPTATSRHTESPRPAAKATPQETLTPPTPTSAPATPEPTPKSEPIKAVPETTPSNPAASANITSLPVQVTPKSGKVLNGFDFVLLGDQQSPVIKINLGERAEFRLAKADTRTYAITLPGFQLAGKHLALPQFPTKDFIGFSMVKAAEVGSGVEVTIGVDPGVRLTAFADGQSILVKLP